MGNPFNSTHNELVFGFLNFMDIILEISGSNLYRYRKIMGNSLDMA